MAEATLMISLNKKQLKLKFPTKRAHLFMPVNVDSYANMFLKNIMAQMGQVQTD
jgi:hypothetical protein